MARSILLQALDLANAGRAGEGVALLENAARQGIAEASYGLGLWSIEGRFLSRDLASARRLIGAAEEQGLLQAAQSLSAMLAAGVGGDRDWPGALAVLQRWQDRDPFARRQLTLIDAMRLDAAGDPLDAMPALEMVSETPWVARADGLIAPDVAAFLIDLTTPRFRPALAFDEASQRFVNHPTRIATAAAFPAVMEWPLVHALNRRIARLSGTVVEQGEPLQVLRYGPGDEYRPHLDAVPGVANQRIMTVLIALSDGFEGGATVFPEAGISWRGKVGDALVFRNVGPDGRPDRASLHAGAAVTQGAKLIASRWIRRDPPPPGEAFGAHEVLPQGPELRQ